MKRYHDDFSVLLNGFALDTLESYPDSVYGLSANLTLNYLNPSWFDFARNNEGEPAITERFTLGVHIGEAMSGPVREYYLEAFRSVLQTGMVWHNEYECSTPETLRNYYQSVYPLYNRNGLIIVNSLVKEQPHDLVSRIPCQPVMTLYLDKMGFITQCSNCRRVQRAAQQDIWDWVPALVEQIHGNASHSFCQICYEYYYAFKYQLKK